MVYFLIITSLTLLVLILIIPFYINIRLKRKEEDDKIQVKFLFLRGLIKYQLDIPFIDIIKSRGEFSLEVKKKYNDGALNDKDITSFEKISNKLNEFYKIKHVILTISKYLVKKIEITKLEWTTKIGFGDAALTSITTGVMWAIMCFLLSIIQLNKSINNLKFDIVPEYNQNVLEIYFDCIIKLKLVHIIFAGINGLRAKLKGGEVHV